MTEEYTIRAFKGTDFKDQNGNTWCSVTFEGVSEPIKWVVKDPTTVNVGDKVYGKITDETSKAGNPYRRFRREKRPEQPENAPQGQSDEYWQQRNHEIRAQWAIGQAVSTVDWTEKGVAIYEAVEQKAKQLYAMVERVASGEPTDEETEISEEDIKKIDEETFLNDIPF